MPEFIALSRGPHTVICLPGLDGSQALIERVVPQLDGEATLLWADYNRARGLTYPIAVEALESAIQRHRPSVIMAESFGSTVAIAWALEHPDRGIPLVLSGPLSWTRRRRCTGWGRFAAWLVPEPLQPFCVWLGSQFVIAPYTIEAVRRNLIRDFCAIPRQAWLDRLAMLLEVDLRPRLKELRAPLTLLWFEKDNVVFCQEEIDLFRAAGHGDAIRLIPGAGHSLWAHVPELVADEVRRHLNGRR
jgi:pimeloyl-ACP methyl ester carboxylesterase